MTIKELLNHQRQTRNICLLKQGLFFRAYGESALLLYELLGYRIKGKLSKSCGEMLYYVGFPASVVDKVVDRIVARGGRMLKQEDGYIEFSDIVSSLDVHSLAELATPQSTPHPDNEKNQSIEVSHKTIIESLRVFDLSNSTPLQSLQLVAQLQQTLHEMQG